MTKISFVVPDAIVEQISELFPGVENAPSKIADIAFREFVDWLTGSRRPGTLSEQTTDRVLALFSEILFDDVPDASFLVSTLGLSLGQARHIIQTLNLKEPGVLRKRALSQLKQVAEEWRERIANYEELIARNVRTVQAPIRVPASLESLYRDIYYEMCRENDSIPSPNRARNLGSEVEYRMDVIDWPTLLSKLDQRIADVP